MSIDRITVQDCIDNYEKKGKVVIIRKGKVVKFIKEEISNGKRNC